MARTRVMLGVGVGVGVVLVGLLGFGLFAVATNGDDDRGSEAAVAPPSIPPPSVPPTVQIDPCATATTSYGACVGPLTAGAVVATPRFGVEIEPEPVLVEEVVAPPPTTPPVTTWLEQCMQDDVCAGTLPNQEREQPVMDPTPPQAPSHSYSGDGIAGIDVSRDPIDVVIIP